MLLSLGEVVAKMDEDSDGVIRVEHVNKVKTYFCFTSVAYPDWDPDP